LGRLVRGDDRVAVVVVFGMQVPYATSASRS
jgi:hypothetical protein